jgi:general secretion pathway protein H
MPTLVNPSKSHSSAQAGFTLVEVMTALLIASMLAGAVMLLWPGENMTVRSTAEKLAARIAAAGDESVLANRQIALVVTSEGYGFDRREPAGWRRLDESSPLAFQSWPDTTGARVEKPAAGDQPGNRIAVFDPLGGATPMRITIGNAIKWVVEIDEKGAVHASPAA